MMGFTTITGLVHMSCLVACLLWLHHAPAAQLQHRVVVMHALALVFAGALLLASDPPDLMADFTDAYYAAGVSLQAGPAGLAPLIERGVEGFVNLPLVAWLFWPFGLLPAGWAMALFGLLGIAATLWCWLLLARLATLDQQRSALLLLLFAANGPLLYGVKEGNTSHFILLLLVLAMTCVKQRREVAAGALFGIAAVIKPPLLLLGAYFLFRRQWRVVAGGSVVVAGCAGLSIMIFGWDLHERWYELCIRRFSGQPVPAFNVQSIQAFVLRIQEGTDSVRDWSPVAFVYPFAVWSKILVAVAALAAFAALLWPRAAATRKPGGDWMMEVQLVVVLVCVISPVSWSHYYTWLLLPIAFFLAESCPFRDQRWLHLAGWMGIVLASAPVVATGWVPGWSILPWFAISTSGLLLAGLLWLVLLVRARAAGFNPPRPAPA